MLSALRRGLGDRRSVAAMEFGIVAPAMLSLVLGTVDAARALLIWEQIHNAANAIAQAAEKLSFTIDPSTGVVSSKLTADQIQQAMTIVYAEIPGLNLGAGGGLFSGSFGVVLSSVTYTPLCAAASGCAAQSASMLWTATLDVGGSRLIQNVGRSCGSAPTQVAHLPNNGTALLDMPSPVLAGGQAMTLTPQIVADVIYDFVPLFPLFPLRTRFYATATLPAPIGDLTTAITLNTSGGSTGVVACQ